MAVMTILAEVRPNGEGETAGVTTLLIQDFYSINQLNIIFHMEWIANYYKAYAQLKFI